MIFQNSIGRESRLVWLVIASLLAGCNVDLYSHQTERDINEMMSVLLNSSIDAHKHHQGDGTYALQISESDRAAAITILENHGLPRRKHMTMRDLFPGDSIVSSPLEERARFIFALEQNLQETLSLIDGVLSARVHVVLPENNPFAASLAPSSASVFLKIRSGVDLSTNRSDIKRIVSNSIEGLNYRDVTLTMIATVTTGDKAHRIATDNRPSQSFNILSLPGLLIALIFLGGLAAFVSRHQSRADTQPAASTDEHQSI